MADGHESAQLGVEGDGGRDREPRERERVPSAPRIRDSGHRARDRREQRAKDRRKPDVGVQEMRHQHRRPHDDAVWQRHRPGHVVHRVWIGALQQPTDAELNDNQHVGALRVVGKDQDLVEPGAAGREDDERRGQSEK